LLSKSLQLTTCSRLALSLAASSPVACPLSNGILAVVNAFAVDNMFAVGVVAGRVIARTISYVGFFAVDDVFALDNLIAGGVAGGVIAHGISSVCIFAVKNDLFAVDIFAIDDSFAVNVFALSIFTVDVLFAADFLPVTTCLPWTFLRRFCS
jgi:hypothetical protein